MVGGFHLQFVHWLYLVSFSSIRKKIDKNIDEDVANEGINRRLMSHNEFIIDILDDLDIEFEYHLWLKRSKGYL